MTLPDSMQRRAYITAILARTEVVAQMCGALHEAWVAPRDFVVPRPGGGWVKAPAEYRGPTIREPRFKPVDEVVDREWINAWLNNGDEMAAALGLPFGHRPFRADGQGGYECDIANLKFDGLPTTHKNANKFAAEQVIQLVLDAFIEGKVDSQDFLKELASQVHDAWVGENYKWAPKGQLVAFDQLSPEEQAKDMAVVLTAVSFMRSYFREMWAQAFEELGRTANGAEQIDGLKNQFTSDELAHGELLNRVASRIQEVWRRSGDEPVWEPVTDSNWFGQYIDTPGLFEPKDGVLRFNLRALRHDQLPDNKQQDNIRAAAGALERIWKVYESGRKVDAAVIEELARAEHADYLAAKRLAGTPFRRPEAAREWDGNPPLPEADKDLCRSMMLVAATEVESFLAQVANFRLGSVQLDANVLRDDVPLERVLMPSF